MCSIRAAFFGKSMVVPGGFERQTQYLNSWKFNKQICCFEWSCPITCKHLQSTADCATVLSFPCSQFNLSMKFEPFSLTNNAFLQHYHRTTAVLPLAIFSTSSNVWRWTFFNFLVPIRAIHWIIQLNCFSLPIDLALSAHSGNRQNKICLNHDSIAIAKAASGVKERKFFFWVLKIIWPWIIS